MSNPIFCPCSGCGSTTTSRLASFPGTSCVISVRPNFCPSCGCGNGTTCIRNCWGESPKWGCGLNDEPAPYDGLHRALLTDCSVIWASKQREHAYLGSARPEFLSVPRSGLFKKRPRWVMAAEVVETSRLFARTVAHRAGMVERLAGPLLKHSHAEPHWEKRIAQVSATERVTLYGLPVVAGRRVNYGPFDPVLAREIFIRHALVEGEFHPRQPSSSTPTIAGGIEELKSAPVAI